MIADASATIASHRALAVCSIAARGTYAST